MSIKIQKLAEKWNLSVEAILIIANSLGIRWARNADSYIHTHTAFRIESFIKTGKDQQPVYVETPKNPNQVANKPMSVHKKTVVWNIETENQVRNLIKSGQSLPKALMKVAPEGFVKKLRGEHKSRSKKTAETKKIKPIKVSTRERTYQSAETRFSEKLETGNIVPNDQTKTLRVFHAKKKVRGKLRSQCQGGCGAYLTEREKSEHQCLGPAQSKSIKRLIKRKL
jgi:hypothetical protein